MSEVEDSEYVDEDEDDDLIPPISHPSYNVDDILALQVNHQNFLPVTSCLWIPVRFHHWLIWMGYHWSPGQANTTAMLQEL